MPELAIVLCSRGLIHSRTDEARHLNLVMAGVTSWLPVYRHGDPIPEAQNSATDEALAGGVRLIWYLEEDVVPPPGALAAMRAGILGGRQVLACPYRNEGGTWAFEKDNQGRVLYTGMGCMLVDAMIFNALPRPYFAAEWCYEFRPDHKVKRTYSRRGIFGGQDVHFCAQLWEAGIPITVLEDYPCKHLKVKTYGKPNDNAGYHIMTEW